MTMEIRRVVTGHDENGKAVVSIDEITTNVVSRRKNQSSTVVWATKGMPPSLDGDEDISHEIDTTIFPGGTVFRTDNQDRQLTKAVGQLWGVPQEQVASPLKRE